MSSSTPQTTAGNGKRSNQSPNAPASTRTQPSNRIAPSQALRQSSQSQYFKNSSNHPSHQHPTQPTASQSLRRSPDSDDIHSRKIRNRGVTLLEIDSECFFFSPPPSYQESTKSIPTTIPMQYSSSPAPSYTSRGSSSVGSVRFSESHDHVSASKSTHIPKHPVKSILKHPKSSSEDMPSLFGENAHIIAASEAIDCVIRDLVTCVKMFKCPDRLDFPASSDNPLLLVQSETNMSFINQLRRLDELRTRLAEIQTHEDRSLEEKHKAAGKAIGKALQGMKGWQMELYNKFFNPERKKAKHESHGCLDLLLTDFMNLVRKLEYPSSLDFLDGPEHKLLLPLTVRNKPFINQLRELEWFRDELNKIPLQDDPALGSKHREISVAIGRALQRMKKHQLELYEESRKAN
ncbi:hypothetical protein OPQ81_011886 [Rhizoctonia solani]|nr:hypothetical protein OPQ81_011886 [Rhizoctonia solani]